MTSYPKYSAHVRVDLKTYELLKKLSEETDIPMAKLVKRAVEAKYGDS